MNDIQTTIKGIQTRLNEIQPGVVVAGLEDEAELVSSMKGDVELLLSSVGPTNLVVSEHHRVMLKSVLNGHVDIKKLRDPELKAVINAAEKFVSESRRELMTRPAAARG